MQMQIIALLFILFINITDSASCKCKNDKNNIYQLTTIIKYLQTFLHHITIITEWYVFNLIFMVFL